MGKTKLRKMIVNPYPGKFIAFEGIDGCGKSTQAKILAENLERLGHKIILTFEPFKRAELKNLPDLKPLERQEAFIQDRLAHLVKEVIPALGAGQNVITDRYFLSTIAYGMSEGIESKRLIDLHENILGFNFILPNLTFLIDTEEAEAMKRLQAKGEIKGYYEKIEKMMEIRRVYLMLYLNRDINKNIHLEMINGDRPIAEVSEEILQKTLEIL